jgi:hypothetical protein
MAFTAPISTQLVNTQQIFVDISCTRLHPNIKKMEKILTQYQLPSYVKYCFHCAGFHENCDGIIWNFLTNLNSNWFEKWTTLVDIHVRPNVKYDFQLVDFHETQAYVSLL